jgi:hypothetical protein
MAMTMMAEKREKSDIVSIKNGKAEKKVKSL